MSTNSDQESKHIISNSQTMIGHCIQWFVDTHGYSSALNIYTFLVKNSFGYRNPYALVKADSLPGSRRGRYQDLEFLEANNIISRSQTINKSTSSYGYVKYTVLEPRESIKLFKLRQSQAPELKPPVEAPVSISSTKQTFDEIKSFI